MDSDDDDEPPMLVDLAAPGTTQPTANTTIPATTNGVPALADEEPSLRPCPVTILSGFLGSGKTTLIQYILKCENHGKRIAVIENEFGEGLAVETMIARDGLNSDSLQEFIELPNGCICCTVKDSLVATLENLVEKKKDLDYILIEASGMANPGPIASVFWLDEALGSRLQLDGIVTVVDANQILDQLASTEEAAQQIAYADRLLINKIDCLQADQTRLDAVTQALRRLHPTAPLLSTTYSQVPNLDWILNANCFGGASRLEELDTLWNQAAQATTHEEHHHHHSHNHNHDPSHGHDECSTCLKLQQQQKQPVGTHKHTAAITSLAYQYEGSVSLSKLNAWLAEILWPQQDESNKVLTALLHDSTKKEQFSEHQKHQQIMQIYRIKGVVSVVHDSNHFLDDKERQRYTTPMGNEWLDQRRYIVQAVHDLWEVHPGSDNLLFEPGEKRLGKIVVIGKYLPRERLDQGFKSCFVEAAAAGASEAIATAGK